MARKTSIENASGSGTTTGGLASCSTTVLEALALGKQSLALARGGTPELAAYQYYDGQLQLAETMPRLVERLVDLLGRAPVTVPLAHSFGMDVSRAIPQLLDLYAE